MRLFILFTIFVWPLIGMSQQPYFTEVKLRPELRDVEVKTLYQDDKSIVWIGTQIGLIRHNGIKERVYDFGNDSICSVTAIYRDKRGVLWIGCEDGKIATLGNDFVSESLLQVKSLGSQVTNISEDDEGNVWASTYGSGVVNISSDNEEISYTTKNGLASNEIYDLVFLSNGELVAAGDRGLSLVKQDGGSNQVRNIGVNEGLSDEIITDIFLTEDEVIYAATNDGGVFVFDIVSRKIIQEINSVNSHVNKVYAIDKNEVFIATDDGLYSFDFRLSKLSKMEVNNLVKGKADHLLIDDESNIWLTSVGGKLIKGNLLFRSIELNQKGLQAVLIVGNDLWIGDGKDLMICREFRNEDFVCDIIKSDINISVLRKVSNDYVAVGTLSQGVLIYTSDGRFKKSVNELQGLPKGSILDIATKDNRVVISSLGGVVELNFQDLLQKKFIKAEKLESLKSRFIYCVHIDSYNETWFGTDARGLIKIDTSGNAEQYDKVYLHSSTETVERKLGSIYSICSDWYGRIWISTSDAGLIRFDGKKFYRFPTLDFISSSPYTSVMPDKSNQLLLIRDGGIDILEPARNHIMYLDRELGIRDQEEQYLNAFTYDEDGDLWYLHSDRLYKYCPTDTNMKIHPSITFNKILVDFSPVANLSYAEFAYDKNNVVFNYDGLWYTDPSKLTFQYILEGYDKSWIVSKDQQATYSDLSPGDYRFRVMACENETFSDEPEAVYEFKILKPFWMRWWFIFLTLVVVIFLIRSYIKFRELSAKRKSDLEKEHISSQLQSLKNQINPHFLFNSFNTLMSLIEENPEEAAIFTEKLSDFYRMMLKYKDQDLISLDEELEGVRSYYSIIRGRFGDNIELEIDLVTNSMLIPPFTIQLLVENAIKHNIIGKENPLSITIRREEDYIEVLNNLQLKLSKATDSGYGLRNIDSRYKLLTGRGIIVKKGDKTFSVQIPVISNN